MSSLHVLVAYCVLALSYLGIGLGYLPSLRVNRAAIALIGSVFLIALGVFDLETAWQAIDATTIAFLLGMTIVNASLSLSGFFSLTLTFLFRLARSPLGLVVVLTFSSGVLSALFLNDTIAIVLTPLTLRLTSVLCLKPIPYLFAVAGATNIGSVATLSGNPQNILIGSFSGIGYLAFARALTPLAIAGLLIQIVWLWVLYPEVRSLKPLSESFSPRFRLFKPLLVKTLVITFGLLIAFLSGQPIGESALLAAALLLLTRRLRSQRLLGAVDWNLLLMFSGLFILTQGVEALGLTHPFTEWVDTSAGLIGVTTLLSNLISNVPAVLLLQPLIPDAEQAWLLLAASSTLAGNLTLLGSVANLVVAEASAQRGELISFWTHLRFGLPLTVFTLLMAYVMLPI